MFTAATLRTGESVPDGLGIGQPEFEQHAFFAKAERFGRVLDAVINLIRNKRHGESVNERMNDCVGSMNEWMNE